MYNRSVFQRWKPYVVLLALGSVVFPGTLCAQHSLRFDHVSVRDGLANNSVFCVLQDHLGFLWFGTFSGLNRFDGRDIRTYRPEPMDQTSLSGSVVFDMLEDSDNRLWIGTGDGLNRYDWESDSFEVYFPVPEDPTSIPSEKIFSLEEADNGSIWVGTADSGIAILDVESGRFTRLPAASTAGLESDVIRALFRDRAGRMWIGTSGGGLSIQRGDGSMTTWLAGSTIRDIFEDSRGDMWIGTEHTGLLYVEWHEGEPRFVTVLPDVTIRTINEDGSGQIWAGTERDGVALIESDGTVRTVAYQADEDRSIGSDFVRDIYVDRSGLVWVATRGGGLSRYNPRSEGFEYVLDGEYTPRQIVEDDAGALWIATDGDGLFRIDNERGVAQILHRRDDPSSLSSDHLYALAVDQNGHIWIGSDGDGLNRLDRSSGQITRYRFDPDDDATIPSDVIWSLLVDDNGRLWIGSEGGGLSLYDAREDRFIRFTRDPDDQSSLVGNSIRALYQDGDGVLWVGTWDGGLSRREADSDRFITFTRNPNDPSSISDNSVNAITETRDGTLWIGTSGGGLNAFDPERGVFRAYRVEDGLPDNSVIGIVPDLHDDLWVATENGLAHFDTATHRFTNYWRSDGLPADEFGRNSVSRTRTGALVMGTGAGVIRFDPERVVPNPFMAPIRITEFSVYNTPVTEDTYAGNRRYIERNIVVSNSINIFPGDSFVGFTFAALDFTDPSKNTFAVQLIGFDPEPHYLGTTNRYFYSSLPPGQYTLRVTGTNSNGVWSTEYADMHVEVHPSFYQRPAFFVLVALVVGTAIALVARVRIRGLHRHNLLLQRFSDNVQDVREEERKAVARDVHDELGQLLTTLKMHIFWLSKNAASHEEQRQARYDSMLGIIGATLDWTKDMATRLRPVALDNLSLAEAVEWLVKETDKHSEVHFQHEIASTPDVSIERATTVFRVVQEILTNIVRHSQATEARVTLATVEDHLCIEIRDNGAGIDRNKLTNPKSYGIVGMRERVRRLGGEIRFRSGTDGTHVLAKIPIGEVHHSSHTRS